MRTNMGPSYANLFVGFEQYTGPIPDFFVR